MIVLGVEVAMNLFAQEFASVSLTPRSIFPNTRFIAHDETSIDVENHDELALILNLSALHRVSGRVDGTYVSECPTVNSVTIMPPGHRFRFEIEGKCRIIAVMLSVNDKRARAAFAGGRHVEPRLNFINPDLAALVWRTVTGSPEGVDDAVTTLADYLALDLPPGQRPAGGGISAARLRRVFDFIEAGIRGPLPLAELASVAAMSSFHFAREFAASTGSPPHRYVLARRLDRAVAALGEDAPIAQVAEECGFANASHLGHHLRRLTGSTPGKIRKFARTGALDG